MSKLPPIAVFDLDGTLADTADDLMDALNHALREGGYAPVDRQLIGYLLGQGALAMIDCAIAHHGAEISENKRQAMWHAFLNHYSKTMPGKTKLFDGVILLLDKMIENGWKIAICTNKSQEMADRLISKMNLSNYFSAICGGDRFEFRKPDGRHILETIKLAGGDTQKAVMFGDSNSDIAGAKNAKIPVVAVPFGYTNTPVEQLNPTLIIQSFEHIDIKQLTTLIANDKA